MIANRLLNKPDLDFHYSLDVGLVEGGEDGVDGHGCGGEVEVVEEDGQVVVQAPRRPEPDVERPARHALDRPDSMIQNQFLYKPCLNSGTPLGLSKERCQDHKIFDLFS